MIGEVLYFTNVQVAHARSAEWDRFYDEWTRVFTEEVTGVVRGSRWRITRGRAAGAPIPDPAWPVYQAFWEHPTFEWFVLSRNDRARPDWQPRAKAFDPWFRSLRDYATIHLHKIVPSTGRGPGLAPAMLSTLWTVAIGDRSAFEAAYERDVLGGVAPSIPHLAGTHRYVAALAHLHRYADEKGKLVVPQRHHFEDGGRLVYATLFELEKLPSDDEQERVLSAFDRALAPWSAQLSDRQEAFAERQLVVEAPAAKGRARYVASSVEPARPERQEMRWSADVAAPPEVVWRSLADQTAWRRWSDPSVEIDAVRPGGGFHVRAPRADWPVAPFSGALAVYDPPRRAEIRWLRSGDQLALSIALEPIASGTRIEVAFLGWEHLREPDRSAQLRAWRSMLDLLTADVERVAVAR